MIETNFLHETALWRDYRLLRELRDGSFTTPIDYRAHATGYYSYERTDRHEARYRQVSRVIEAFAPAEEYVLVDVGAGVGTLSGYLRRAGGCRYCPIEIDRAGLDAMRASRLLPVCANGWDLPFATGSAGVLFAGELIEHLYLRQFAEFMEEVRRVVAPNGLAVFTTPNWESKPAREDRRQGLIPYSFDPDRNQFASEHVLPFTFESLREVFEHFGFDVFWESTNQITHCIVPPELEIFADIDASGERTGLGDSILMAARKKPG